MQKSKELVPYNLVPYQLLQMHFVHRQHKVAYNSSTHNTLLCASLPLFILFPLPVNSLPFPVSSSSSCILFFRPLKVLVQVTSFPENPLWRPPPYPHHHQCGNGWTSAGLPFACLSSLPSRP